MHTIQGCTQPPLHFPDSLPQDHWAATAAVAWALCSAATCDAQPTRPSTPLLPALRRHVQALRCRGRTLLRMHPVEVPLSHVRCHRCLDIPVPLPSDPRRVRLARCLRRGSDSLSYWKLIAHPPIPGQFTCWCRELITDPTITGQFTCSFCS